MIKTQKKLFLSFITNEFFKNDKIMIMRDEIYTEIEFTLSFLEFFFNNKKKCKEMLNEFIFHNVKFFFQK